MDCSPRSCVSACHAGRGCRPRSYLSACHASTACVLPSPRDGARHGRARARKSVVASKQSACGLFLVRRFVEVAARNKTLSA
jgi:hypothetical protein